MHKMLKIIKLFNKKIDNVTYNSYKWPKNYTNL